MSNRRRLARERIEIYLVHLILSYRPMTLMVGLLVLVTASTTAAISSLAGSVLLLTAVFLLLLSLSFHIVLYTARLGAWIGTLWRRDD
ncbi:MAG: hypothetical protein JW934_15770 [Anaerolineae bacterium]|nr:hypothetical protein [Anaerolineae bacterium]